jgi:hypothetical protein
MGNGRSYIVVADLAAEGEHRGRIVLRWNVWHPAQTTRHLAAAWHHGRRFGQLVALSTNERASPSLIKILPDVHPRNVQGKDGLVLALTATSHETQDISICYSNVSQLNARIRAKRRFG